MRKQPRQGELREEIEFLSFTHPRRMQEETNRNDKKNPLKSYIKKIIIVINNLFLIQIKRNIKVGQRLVWYSYHVILPTLNSKIWKKKKKRG